MSGGPQLVDPGALERLRGWGGAALVDRMIGLFQELGPKRLQEVGDGLAEGDLSRVARAAHSFKSSAGNLGADRLRLLCGALEDAADGGRQAEARRLADDLPHAYRDTVKQIAVLARAHGPDSPEGKDPEDKENSD